MTIVRTASPSPLVFAAATALVALPQASVAQQPASCAAEASVFLPGIGSQDSTHDDYVTMSPSGDSAVFTRMGANYARGTLYMTVRTGASWSDARPLPFSGTASDSRPFFAPDGRRLYFASNRSDATGGGGDAHGGLDIWYVDVTASGWSTPVNAGPGVNTPMSESHPSVTRAGTLYFTRFGMSSPNDILRALRTGNGFGQAVALDSSVNTRRADSHPSIDPEERFLLFARDAGAAGGDEIFVAWRHGDGWTDVEKLPPPVQSALYDYSAKFVPDGSGLLFSRADFRDGGRRADIMFVPRCALPARLRDAR